MARLLNMVWFYMWVRRGEAKGESGFWGVASFPHENTASFIGNSGAMFVFPPAKKHDLMRFKLPKKIG